MAQFTDSFRSVPPSRGLRHYRPTGHVRARRAPRSAAWP